MRGEQYPNACGAGGGSRGREGGRAGRGSRPGEEGGAQQPTAAHVARPSSVGFGLQAAGGGGRTCGRDGSCAWSVGDIAAMCAGMTRASDSQNGRGRARG